MVDTQSRSILMVYPRDYRVDDVCTHVNQRNHSNDTQFPGGDHGSIVHLRHHRTRRTVLVPGRTRIDTGECVPQRGNQPGASADSTTSSPDWWFRLLAD